MHLVLLRLEVGEEATRSVPTLGADARLAAPVIPFEDEAPVRLGQLLPRHVDVDPGLGTGAETLAQSATPRGTVPRLDGSFTNRQAAVRNDAVPVDLDDPSEASALGAGTVGRVERKEPRCRIRQARIASGTTKSPREAAIVGSCDDARASVAGAKGLLDRVGAALTRDVRSRQAIDDDLQVRLAAILVAQIVEPHDLALAQKPQKALALKRLGDDLGRLEAAERNGSHDESGKVARVELLEVGEHRARILGDDGRVALRTESVRATRVEQLEVVVDARQCADGRTRSLDGTALIDRDRRRDALELVDVGPREPIEKLTRVRREGLDVSPLAFRVERVEGERGLARSADARHDRQLAERNVEVEIAEIVLPSPAQADGRHRSVRGIRGVRGA